MMRFYLLLLSIAIVVVTAFPQAKDALQEELQELLTHTSDVTGYALTLGYVDATGRDFGLGAGQRDPQGFPSIIGGNTTESDRFLFGSGTKPFTAAAIVRLHERGVIKSLDENASKYIDPVLSNLNRTASLVGMLGERAGRVTVRHLIQMQSGIADFDVPGLDNKILVQNSCSPVEIIQFVSSLRDEVCKAASSGVCSCRFMCEPGDCTSYSSTNYVLAGLVLAGATAVQPSTRHGSGSSQVPMWQRFNTELFTQTLGLDKNKAFANSKFSFPVGGSKLRDSGLTVAGSSIQYGKTELWEQDAAVLGFTCGNCIASAHDAARFYYQLLGPPSSIVSLQSLAMMQETRTLDAGWAAGHIDYGTGLMIQNISPKQSLAWERAGHRSPTPANLSASYIGHAGDTYAFQSDNGFFRKYNASISIVVNQDTEPPAEFITCQVLQVVARHFGDKEDFGCRPLPSQALYACMDSFGEKVCVEAPKSSDPRRPGGTMTYKQCTASCKGPAPPPSPPGGSSWKCSKFFGKKVCLPKGGASTYEDCKSSCS